MQKKSAHKWKALSIFCIVGILVNSNHASIALCQSKIQQQPFELPHFTEIARSLNIDHPAKSISATWVDYDKDGFLDLYVANGYNQGNVCYRNLGDGRFSEVTAANENALASGDSIGVTNFTYHFRISRTDTLIQVQSSDDGGRTFAPMLADALRSDLMDQPQLLVLTGNCWFVPAGSYADWDYIRFWKLD